MFYSRSRIIAHDDSTFTLLDIDGADEDATYRSEKSVATSTFCAGRYDVGPPALSVPVREQVVKQILKQDEADVRWIMEQCLRIRPSLREVVEDAVCSTMPDGSSPLAVNQQDLSPDSADEGGMRSKTMSTQMIGDPVVQFSKSVYFFAAPAGDTNVGYANVDVVRLGSVANRSEVPFATGDLTAKDGTTYRATQGVLLFEPGDSFKSIHVPLIHKPEWNPPLDFQVELLDRGLLGARLDANCQARVEVIDHDTFPSNRYEDLTFAGKLGQASHLGLAWEFIRMQLRSPMVCQGFIKTLIGDSFANLYVALKVLLQLYLVDYVLNNQRSEEELFFVQDRCYSLVLVGAIYAVPQSVMHYVELSRPFGVGSNARAMLQKGLFSTFLNYNLQTLASLREGDLIMAMARDSLDVVDELDKGLLTLLRLLGEIVMLCLLQIIVPIVFHQQFHYTAIIPIFGYPALQLTFLSYRERVTHRFVFERDNELDRFVEHISDSIRNRHLVAHCQCRSRCFRRFEHQVETYNRARKIAKHALVNNHQFSLWLAVLFVSIYIMFGGSHVASGDLSLGVYLMNIRIYKDMGDTYKIFYKSLLELQAAIPALLRLTNLMNQPTNLQERMDLSRHQHVLAESLIARLHASQDDATFDAPLVDQLPIQIGNFFVVTGEDEDNSKSYFSGMMEFKQGQFVHVVGLHGQGKSVLLQSIGGHFIPQVPQDPSQGEARFFIPPHLHVIYVSASPSFFRAPLLDNLLLGSDREGELPRVMSICRRLGLSKVILDHIESGDSVSWMEILSHEESALLCIARALVANPEVLCVERHWMGFDHGASQIVQDMLKEFVQQRGVEQGPDSRHRRPRTCIWTLNHPQQLLNSEADPIFLVSYENGIQKVSLTQVTLAMLG